MSTESMVLRIHSERRVVGAWQCRRATGPQNRKTLLVCGSTRRHSYLHSPSPNWIPDHVEPAVVCTVNERCV